jgi:hypothetical protein
VLILTYANYIMLLYNVSMSSSRIAFKSLVIILGIVLVSHGNIYAGSITAPGGAPSATSYTLTDIFNRIKTNATATLGNHSLSPTTTPQSSFHSLTEIYNAIPTIDPAKVILGTTYLGIAGTAIEDTPITPANKVPLKTGQTLCYNAAGAVIACAGTGQDGEIQAGTARSYTDNSDGTISDNATGLMWQKCTYGLSGTDCLTGSATLVSGHNSTSTCETATTAGHTDWKLPNINELATLVDYSKPYPDAHINTTYFPNTKIDDDYWSSSQYIYSRPGVWIQDFSEGATTYENYPATEYIRCVRIQASPASSATAQPLQTEQTPCFESRPYVFLGPESGLERDCTGLGQDGEYQAGIAHSFTDNDDGTITDNATGLMWEKCPYYYTGTYCDSYDQSDTLPFDGLSEAITICNNATTGSHTDWRVPNINELKSLVVYDTQVRLSGFDDLALELKYFPNIQGTLISSTRDATDNGSYEYLYSIDPSSGGYTNIDLGPNNIQCVRD